MDAEPILAYPRFRAVEGAVGGYKFKSGQFVLRGRSCVTPPGMSARLTGISSRRTRVGNSRTSAWRRTRNSSAFGETIRRDQMTTDKIARTWK